MKNQKEESAEAHGDLLPQPTMPRWNAAAGACRAEDEPAEAVAHEAAAGSVALSRSVLLASRQRARRIGVVLKLDA